MVSRRAGTIVLVSSLAGYVGYPTSVPYAAFKAGLVGLFRSLVHEAAQYDVRIHLIAPGFVDTGIFAAATYRGTDYSKTMRLIDEMGFPLISAKTAAATILKGVRKGSPEIFFPNYARLLARLGPRMPVLIDAIHRSMLKHFHNIAQ
jgi:short-subunit dehydrogenase